MVGSSPRMWGTLGIKEFCLDFGRFIPTDVGNTPPAFYQWNGATVHPHGCGEHHLLTHWPRPFGGSSPRMWGTH